MRALHGKHSYFCPTCLVHTEQGRLKSGNHLCSGCGEEFSAKDSEQAKLEYLRSLSSIQSDSQAVDAPERIAILDAQISDLKDAWRGDIRAHQDQCPATFSNCVPDDCACGLTELREHEMAAIESACAAQPSQSFPEASPRLWAVYQDDYDKSVGVVRIVQMDGYGNVLRLIARMPKESDWPQSRANAELIVAAVNSFQSGAQKMNTQEAFATLKASLQADSDYAWSWHCNIAMAVYDESRPKCYCETISGNPFEGHMPDCSIVRAHDAGGYEPLSSKFCNNAAARLMQICFGVDTSKSSQFAPSQSGAREQEGEPQ